MRLRYFSLVLVFFSCVDDGDSPVADATSSSVCDCEELTFTAEQISYDNAGSSLQSTSVQGAVSELSMREVEFPDIADRFSIQQNEQSNTGGELLHVGVSCGGGAAMVMAIGGGCESNDPNLHLVRAELIGEGYVCNWTKPLGQLATGTAQVSCLSLIQ